MYGRPKLMPDGRTQTVYIKRCSCGKTAPKKLVCGKCSGAIPQVDAGSEARMKGTCGTCKLEVTCARYEASAPKPPRKRVTGAWDDLHCVECPRCKARVFVHDADGNPNA